MNNNLKKYRCRLLKVDSRNGNGDIILKSDVLTAMHCFETEKMSNSSVGRIFINPWVEEQSDEYLIGNSIRLFIDDDDYLTLDFQLIDTPAANIFFAMNNVYTKLGVGVDGIYKEDGEITRIYGIKSFVIHSKLNDTDLKNGLAITEIEDQDKKDENLGDYEVFDDAECSYPENAQSHCTDDFELNKKDFGQKKEEYYYDFQVAPYALQDICEALHWNGINDAVLTKEDGDIHIRWKRDLNRKK